MRRERLFLSISALPWGSVWTGSIYELWLSETDTHYQLFCWSCIHHGVIKSCSEACGRKAHRLQQCVVSPSSRHHRPSTIHLRVPAEWNVNIIFWLLIVRLSHCCCQCHCLRWSLVHPDCIPTCGRAGNQGTSKFRKCCFTFFFFLSLFRLLWSWWWQAKAYQVHCFVLFSTVCDIYEIGFII